MSPSLRLGLVSPRFEPVTAVGAEVQVRELARRLSARGHSVEVLTTCARDLWTWKNHYSPGLWQEKPFAVRRFPADPRRVRRRTLEIGAALRRGAALPPAEQEEWILSLGSSSALAGFLRDRGSGYDAFLFAPALSGTAFGAPPGALRRAVLLSALPCTPVGRLEVLRERYGPVPLVAVGSETEREAVRTALGHRRDRTLMAGAAVDPAPSYDPGGFRRRHGLEAPFLMYVGRRTAGKGVERLVEWAAAVAGGGGVDLRLVLAGEERVEVPAAARPFVVDLNFIEDQDRADGMAAALAVCQPSAAEGIALAPMEGWLAGRPVLADAAGAVTVERCRDGGGGLWYRDYGEFNESVRLLLEDGDRAALLGQQGRSYVQGRWTWRRCLDGIETALRAAAGEKGP